MEIGMNYFFLEYNFKFLGFFVFKELYYFWVFYFIKSEKENNVDD